MIFPDLRSELMYIDQEKEEEKNGREKEREGKKSKIVEKNRTKNKNFTPLYLKLPTSYSFLVHHFYTTNEFRK